MTLVPVDRPVDSNAEAEDVTGELRGFYDSKEPLLLFRRDRWVFSWLVCTLFSLLALLTHHRNLASPSSLCRDTYTRPESETHKLMTRRWVYLLRTLRRCCMVWYVSSNCVWLTNLTRLLVTHGNLSDITRWSRGVFGVRICEFPVFQHVTYGNLQCCLYSIVQIGRDTIISRQLGWLIDQEY